jgi:chromosome partitioning protein
VLGLLDRKGGTGKTTLAIHFGVLAQEGRKRVVLMDLDPRRSNAGRWRTRDAETPPLVETELDRLFGILDSACADGVDVGVLHTLTSVAADAVQVATSAVVLVIATRPAILDLRAILEMLNLMKGSREAYVVLNECHAPAPRGTVEASAATDARKALLAFGVPVAGPTTNQRAVFSHALVGGLAATEAEPSGKAAHEMRARVALRREETCP